jgi:hypothetical protein
MKQRKLLRCFNLPESIQAWKKPQPVKLGLVVMIACCSAAKSNCFNMHPFGTIGNPAVGVKTPYSSSQVFG